MKVINWSTIVTDCEKHEKIVSAMQKDFAAKYSFIGAKTVYIAQMEVLYVAKPVDYDNTIKPTDGIYLELYDVKTVAGSATTGESWRDDTQNNILSVSVTLDGAERTQA